MFFKKSHNKETAMKFQLPCLLGSILCEHKYAHIKLAFVYVCGLYRLDICVYA